MRVAQGSHLDAGSEAILPRLCFCLGMTQTTAPLCTALAPGETHVLFLSKNSGVGKAWLVHGRQLLETKQALG